ncbi:MAG: AAA family ATPase [Candidatus Lokiarchaeota archaeon]|nr:AAA family ATPase [Candidatus Lokiarchaeota archaeon]
MKTNIVLIGFMGTGKTSVGKILSDKLNKRLVEMDDVIVEKAGKTIPEIFDEDGEIVFREIEMQVCKELGQAKDSIISAGGGIILNKLNVDYLQKSGFIILLQATAQDIFNRISIEGKEKRPLLNKPNPMKEIKDLLSFRSPFYERAAEIKINTHKKVPEQIADEIIEKIEKGQTEDQVSNNLGSLFNELSDILINGDSSVDDLNKYKTSKPDYNAELYIIKKCLDFKPGSDPLLIVQEIMNQKEIKFMSWHYSGIVPGVILAIIKNFQKSKEFTEITVKDVNGNDKKLSVLEISPEKIAIGVKRGMMIPYGSKGYLGISEAAIGAGIATSVMLGATPKTPILSELSNLTTSFALRDLLEKKLLQHGDLQQIIESAIISTLKFFEKELKIKILE